MYNQHSVFFDKIFSKYQCGFRKGCKVPHCLINLLEKWRQSRAKDLDFGALLTDLSSVRLIYDYLMNRKQRTKIGNNYSPCSEIRYRVPQGSSLGPLLFNTHICNRFFLLFSPYIYGENLEFLIKSLEQLVILLFN